MTIPPLLLLIAILVALFLIGWLIAGNQILSKRVQALETQLDRATDLLYMHDPEYHMAGAAPAKDSDDYLTDGVGP